MVEAQEFGLSPFVVVQDLVVRFRSAGTGRSHYITPVDRVSFAIAPGEVLALVGESGSGKSTLGRSLVRFHEPSAGRIEIGGVDVTHVRGTKALRDLRRKVQMIFQDPFASLNPVRTVGQHLRVAVEATSSLRGREAMERAHALLEQVGISPGRDAMGKYPHELSGGQRQRVAIARALAGRPQCVVADEPISMLDVSIRADILGVLAQLKTEYDLSFLYITHDLASARYFGDRIMVMYGGQVMETGSSDDLVLRPLHPYTRLLLSATPGNGVSAGLQETSIESPNLLEGRTGCPFAHRCTQATALCYETQPAMRDVNATHRIACHHAQW